MRALSFFTIAISVWLVFCVIPATVIAAPVETTDSVTIDRIQLVNHQISLLKNRLTQGEHELTELQTQNDQPISPQMIEHASKNLLDKAALDILVSQSNLESLNIELADTQQTISWLEKNIQEIENQLNVLNMFGLKTSVNEAVNVSELRSDVGYQERLLQLEKERLIYIQNLLKQAQSVAQLKKDNYDRINALLKSRKILHVKQQQVKDELAFQLQQNYWLQQLNLLHAKLAKIDPIKARSEYSNTERSIFYANESANFAYVQSLVARYKDQIQQMKLAVTKNNSISLLNELTDQVQILSKQINRLENVLATRIGVLEKHISYLSPRRASVPVIGVYIDKLAGLKTQYKIADNALLKLNTNLTTVRKTIDQSLQTELSSREGLPTFGTKTIVELGKEILLVPALTFQVLKSLSNHLMKALNASTVLTWCLFLVAEVLLILIAFFAHRLLSRWVDKPTHWRDRLNTKWLSLLCLNRNFIDFVVICNLIGIMLFFSIPVANYSFAIYLAFVWLLFKGIITLAQVCLVETTHDNSGHDVRLYHRLKWIIFAGGLITGLTVFVHQLPLIYEFKTLCDRLFLFILMIVSLLMLKSSHVVPNLILMHMEHRHPYFQKSVRLIGVLVPLLMFCNSIIGLLGFVNLIMTVSWYEGIFLLVLIGYLIVRGLLTDGMELLSRLLIQYVNNGWLWTEAFLKPIDKVLRITLFLTAWAVLFLLYGWDQQSPIVERLTRLLQYQLISVLNTSITPISIIELVVVISVFYWTAKWTREFVYRMLLSRTKDMGIRNSLAILSQYSVIVVGAFLCLRVLNIDLRLVGAVAGMFAFGVGLGLRDLANNFACGFLILLERPLRVGDIVNINGVEGDVTNIGSRAVTIKTWDHMELVVPNAEIFNKAFTNWTARDNTVRTIAYINISRHDNPHEVKVIIQSVLAAHKDILKNPAPEVFLKNMSDTLMEFEIRYFVNIRQVSSRTSVLSTVLLNIWDSFAEHGIKPPYPQQEIVLRRELPQSTTSQSILSTELRSIPN